jgi:hypothetical protein
MGDDRASATAETAPAMEMPDSAGYPPLQSVPPRPQLSYTIQQQRQIVEALIADRENARYTSQVIRHRSGLSSLPPPPAPPEPANPVTIEPGVASRDGTEPERRLSEQETLVDFLGALLFDEPATAPDAAEPAPPDPASEPEELSSAAPEVPLDRREPAPAPTASATDAPSKDTAGQAPVPPARSAVAARLAAGPDVIDDLVDQTVPQTPLPPGQSALAARLAAAERIDVAAPLAAPLPTPRPAKARPAGPALQARVPDRASPPAPPPIKPILPVGAPMPPRPAEKPTDDRSASAHGVPQVETAPTGPFAGKRIRSTVANPLS